MPNYGLVVTPEYKPMSYEQYVQPFKDYAQVYNTMADSYDALEMEANQWEKLANSAVDAPQYAQYKKYADDLHAAAADLATNGLTNKTRGALSQLRKRYAGEIKPIEEAFNYRQKMAEEQRKLNPNGSKLFDVDYGNIGLGYIMDNPSAGYKTVDLPSVTKEVADVVSNYKKVLMDSGEWGKTNVSGLLERIETYGLTPEDIDAITNKDSKEYNNPLYQQIRDIVNRAYYNTGVEDWGDNTKSETVYRAALQGVPYGLGTGNVKNVEDPWMSYYIWKKQQSDLSKDVPSEKFWDYVGTDVDVSDDADIKEQKKTLDTISSIAQSGKVPEKNITKEVYVSNAVQAAADRMANYIEEQQKNPNWNPDEDQTLVALNVAFVNAINSSPSGSKKETRTINNPNYKLYKELSERYNTEDLSEIRKLFENDYNKSVKSKATINKYTILNSATNERTVTNWLNNQLTSGNDDKELKRLVKIEKKGEQKDMSRDDLSNLRKALRDDSTSLQVNWNNGKLRIHNSSYGTYYLDPSVLHNINMPFLGGVLSGDRYIPAVSQLYNAGKIGEDALKIYIDNFYHTIVTNSRMLLQEPGKTNAKNQE